jgi:hypothetical protein
MNHGCRACWWLSLLVVATAANGQSPDAPGIWGRTILAQPFDHQLFGKQPFREVRIPGWVEETIGCGYTLSGATEAQRKRAIELGVTISELGFVDPFFVYYDSKLLRNRSPHVPPDHVDKEVAAYRRLGLKILAVYPPCLQSEAYANHPEWRRIATNTKEIPQVDLKVHGHGGMLCLLGPYGDFFIDVLAEITEKYQVDAFSFDGLHYGGVCYCEHCRTAYREQTGGEIPDVNLDDLAFRRYQHWADRRMENLIQRMQTRLKGIKPDVALVTWTTNAGRFGHLRDIPRNMPARMNLLLDAPDQEFWMDETNRGATIVPAFANAYIWACTNHRVAFSEPYLMSHGNPYGKDSFPAHEIQRRVLLAITHGARPSLAVAQPAHMQKGAYDALAEIQKRKPWLTHVKPEPWGAMLVSDNTRVMYGRSPGKVEERYLASVFGMYRAVLEEHLPVTLICDWNLTPEELAKYQVLILPNAACLSDAQADAVREFVRKGGGLVASLDTSLCDEFGEPRKNFALADVLGVEHAGLFPPAGAGPEAIDVNFAKGLDAAYWEKRSNVFQVRLTDSFKNRDERLAALVGSEPVTFKGPAIRVKVAERADVAATCWPHGGDEKNSSPAIVAHPFGKGKVVYFAAGLDAGYYRYSYPYQRVLLARAIRSVAGDDPLPVEVTAPMCVHATVFRQDKQGQQRLLVHLYNDVNTTAQHGLPDDDVPLREETLPIHDIRLTLPMDLAIRRASQQPDGRELQVVTNGNVKHITVPRLEVHSIVVIDLESSAQP